LREKQPFQLFATPAILGVLDENPIFNVLDPACVARNCLPLGKEIELAPGLLVEAFAVPGKVALYLEDSARKADGELNIGSETEDTIGLRISAASSGASFFYVPGCAEMTRGLKDRLRDADLVLFDGTVWENEEMITHGVGEKTGQRMGHLSMSGEKGSLAAFEGLNIARKVFVHINNTNPVLVEDSRERAAVERAGWEVGRDGMEITLP
jgi:pyrroloquinoline quinone biosynthesis protein B